MKRLAAASTLLALVLFGTPARAETSDTTIDECIEAAESVQRALRDGRYTAGRTVGGQCMASACPGELRRDCADALDSIEAATPSIVVSVQSSRGVDLPGAQVSIDGAAATNDGRPLRLDPGTHIIAATMIGFVPLQQPILVATGVKNRLVQIKLTTASNERVAPVTRRRTTATWVATASLLALGVAGATVATAFGVAGMNQNHDLGERCGSHCSDDDLSSLHAKLVTADISWVVTAAALGSGVAVFLFGPRTTPRAE